MSRQESGREQERSAEEDQSAVDGLDRGHLASLQGRLQFRQVAAPCCFNNNPPTTETKINRTIVLRTPTRSET